MQAAFIKTKGKVVLRDVPVQVPVAGEILIRVDACGICGSDFIEASHWAKNWKRFGHEIAGTVYTVGDNVTDFHPGDKVVPALSVACGECPACSKGLPRYCSQLIVAEQGGFAEYLLIRDARLLQKVSSSMAPQLACLAEPLTVILEAFHLADLCEHDSLLVAGGGFLGTLAMLTAHLMRVPVVGLLSRHHDDNARTVLAQTGGEHIPWHALTGMAFSMPALKTLLSRHTGRTVVLHTAPPHTLSSYLKALPYAATVVNIGLSGKRKENNVNFDAAGCVFKRTQLLHAFPVPCLHLKKAISLLEQHAETFSILKTSHISLAQLPKHFSARHKGEKTIVRMEE